MLQQTVTRACCRKQTKLWASSSFGALSLSGGSMQALKECPARMQFLNSSCSCSDAFSLPVLSPPTVPYLPHALVPPISTHNA